MSTRFGNFELLTPLAAGGMAVTHLARHADDPTSPVVVVKRIRPEIASEDELRELFRAETEFAQGLVHPNIVRTLGAGEVDGELYLLLEFVQGADLRDIGKTVGRAKEKIPTAAVASIIRSAARGLDHAHDYGPTGKSLGLVHRDVSPPNIMVGFDGRVAVIDFGIARVERAYQRVREGQLKGKFAYMSPEQVEGLAVDRRSDVFSLGILLWEFTVGRRLFKTTSNIATLAAISEARVTRPSELLPDYDTALESIVMKALARDRRDRFQTAGELADALDAWLSGAEAVDLGEWMADHFPERVARVRELTGGVYDAVPDSHEPKMEDEQAPPEPTERPRDGEIQSVVHELAPDPDADPFHVASAGGRTVLGIFTVIGVALLCFIAFRIATDGIGTSHLADADVTPNIGDVDVEFVPPPPLDRTPTRITSEPAGALVVLNAVATGQRTPAEVALVTDETNVLSLHLDRHATTFIEVEAGTPGHAVLTLVPEPEPTQPDPEQAASAQLGPGQLDADGSGEGSADPGPPPPPPGHGRVRVVARDTSGAPVAADVMVNGVSTGTAPFAFDTLARQEVHVTVRAEGFRDSAAYVAPIAYSDRNSEAEVILEMTRDAGDANRWTTARLRTSPRDSQFSVNGEIQTLPMLLNLPSSEFSLLRATAPDHRPVTRAIEGGLGQVEFLMRMSPILDGPAAISIATEPEEGITVYLERIRHGSAGAHQVQLPLERAEHPAGDYRITLEYRHEEGRTRERFEVEVLEAHDNRFVFGLDEEGALVVLRQEQVALAGE